MEKKQRQIRSVWKKVLRRGAMGVGIGNLISSAYYFKKGADIMETEEYTNEIAADDDLRLCALYLRVQRDRLCVRGGESVVRM